MPDKRMYRLDEYVYMKDGKLVYQSIYQKQFTAHEFRRLLEICENHCDDERINYNKVIDEWDEEESDGR